MIVVPLAVVCAVGALPVEAGGGAIVLGRAAGGGAAPGTGPAEGGDGNDGAAGALAIGGLPVLRAAGRPGPAVSFSASTSRSLTVVVSL
jgi:hypothetical protein